MRPIETVAIWPRKTLEPYIEHDRHRLFFVPVLRQRLNFAVLVRRALRDLAPWTDRDLIAVALPPSVLSVVRGAVRTEPEVLPVSLVIAKWGDSDYREVFPITPCDGVIEAIRYAVENRRPVEAIDRDIKPGNLIQRRCLDDPGWPDDDLALRWGPARFLELIADRIAQPPVRFEPIDTWRESCMADRLRELQPRYHRILVVCEAVHIAAVRRLLRIPSRQYDGSDERYGAPGLQLLRASPDVTLRYLDDFPRLAELYEHARRSGRAAEFEKFSELFRTLQNSNDASIPHGTRRLQSFHRYLLFLLEQARRISPRPYELQQACRGCFGNDATNRLIHYLGGYGKEISFERIGEIVPDGDAVYAVRTPDPGPEGKFLSRSCNSTRTQYRLLPRPETPMHDPSDRQSIQLLGKNLRQKALSLASLQEHRQHVMAFRGSIEGGIDARRTLRSLLTAAPAFYVRDSVRQYTRHDHSNEPIVWILKPVVKGRSIFNEYRLSCTCFAAGEPFHADGSNQFPTKSSYGGHQQTIFESDDGVFAITKTEQLGFLSFYDGVTDLAEARKLMGHEFALRVPVHSRMELNYNVGCIMKELVVDANKGAPWWEILMLTALITARESVVCVLPDGFRLPDRVVAEAHSRGKRVVCARLSNFSRDDRARLGQEIRIEGPPGMNQDDKLWDRASEAVKRLGILF